MLQHGFHIHECGDCAALDGTSAGGHFNHANQPHAGPDHVRRHIGDLGNIEADNSGNAHYKRTDTHLKFDGRDSIIGRGVIVHAGVDDLVSQPSGNAGPQIAGGVIGVARVGAEHRHLKPESCNLCHCCPTRTLLPGVVSEKA